MQPANRPHPEQGPCSAQALPLQLARWWWQRTNNPRHPGPGAARSGGARLWSGSSRSKLPVTRAEPVDIVRAMALLVRWSIRLLICGGEAGNTEPQGSGGHRYNGGRETGRLTAPFFYAATGTCSGSGGKTSSSEQSAPRALSARTMARHSARPGTRRPDS
jgi:hypothetical protein